MRYLDLNILTAHHLFGSWQLLERPSSRISDDTPFATCNQVIFLESGDLQVVSGQDTTSGKWKIFKETEIIYNPQLNFSFSTSYDIINAIITRFREDDEEDHTSRKLTLYFTSGLELVLEQQVPLPA